jgi:uncharacterized protein YcgL (UPF0745 family)
MKEVKLYIEDNEDTYVLLNQLKEEYDKPRLVILQLADIEGQVVTGRCMCVVGTLEDGSFLLTGNVDDVLFSL